MCAKAHSGCGRTGKEGPPPVDEAVQENVLPRSSLRLARISGKASPDAAREGQAQVETEDAQSRGRPDIVGADPTLITDPAA